MTVIGTLLVIFGFIRMTEIFYAFATIDPPADTPQHAVLARNIDFGIFEASAFLSFLCGAFILRGANWARWLFTAKWIIFLGINFLHVVGGGHLLSFGAIVVYGIMIFFSSGGARTISFRRVSGAKVKREPAVRAGFRQPVILRDGVAQHLVDVGAIHVQRLKNSGQRRAW